MSTLLEMNGCKVEPKFKDVQMITTAMQKRWPIDEEMKMQVIAQARKWLTMPGLSAKEVAMWSKILVMAEKQNQDDEHLQAQYDRVDAGKATSLNKHTVILDGPIRPQSNPVKAIESMVVPALPPPGDKAPDETLPPERSPS